MDISDIHIIVHNIYLDLVLWCGNSPDEVDSTRNTRGFAFLKDILDIENKPIYALGIFTAGLLFILYWSIAGIVVASRLLNLS